MPTYYTADGTYHKRRRCRALHRTSDRITRTDSPGDRDACERCVPASSEQAASVAELLDNNECPWCTDYDGEHVGRHASRAHPEAWTDHQEADT